MSILALHGFFCQIPNKRAAPTIIHNTPNAVLITDEDGDVYSLRVSRHWMDVHMRTAFQTASINTKTMVRVTENGRFIA